MTPGVPAARPLALPLALRRLAADPEDFRRAVDVFSGQVMFPDEVRTGDGLLLLAVENQGVCEWLVPLDAGDEPPVLAAVDGSSPVPFASSVEALVEAWLWDGACIGREPLVQAQAAPLDDATERFVRSRMREVHPTTGWPSERQLRFVADDGTALLLWSGGRQCDWWLSAPSEAVLERWVRDLLARSDLATSFWSNDEAGEALLARVRGS